MVIDNLIADILIGIAHQNICRPLSPIRNVTASNT